MCGIGTFLYFMGFRVSPYYHLMLSDDVANDGGRAKHSVFGNKLST